MKKDPSVCPTSPDRERLKAVHPGSLWRRGSGFCCSCSRLQDAESFVEQCLDLLTSVLGLGKIVFSKLNAEGSLMKRKARLDPSPSQSEVRLQEECSGRVQC